jgi:hypothetical protein
VKLVDMLVHGPQSTNVIDLIGDGGSMTTIRQSEAITSHIAEIGPHNRCEPSIYECRSMVGNHCEAKR